MKRHCLALICLLLLLPASPPSWAEPNWSQPNWTEQAARQAASEVDLVAELRPLFERARAGEDADLRRRLEAVAVNEKWPLPARERLLHAFALGLGDLPPGAAGPESLGYLLDYRPRILVPHEDHASAGVPLFNIPAAASGSMNLWRRQTAYDTSRAMLAQSASTRSASTPSASTWSAESWVAAWLAADPASRRGFLDALELAPERRLREVAALALRDLPQRPELTPVAARSAAILPAPDLLGDTLILGKGPELATALRLAANTLDETERAGLLRRLVAEAPASNAALAIAELARGLLHDPAVADLLFDLLGDPALGATAALALAGSRQPAVRERLAELAQRDDDAPSRRAAAALATALRTDGGDPR